MKNIKFFVRSQLGSTITMEISPLRGITTADKSSGVIPMAGAKHESP
jgi:hypothetical protein